MQTTTPPAIAIPRVALANSRSAPRHRLCVFLPGLPWRSPPSHSLKIGRGHCIWTRLRRTLPKKQRRERFLLMQFDLALANEFQRRGETRGEDGRLLRGIDDVMQE